MELTVETLHAKQRELDLLITRNRVVEQDIKKRSEELAKREKAFYAQEKRVIDLRAELEQKIAYVTRQTARLEEIRRQLYNERQEFELRKKGLTR